MPRPLRPHANRVGRVWRGHAGGRDARAARVRAGDRGRGEGSARHGRRPK
jgi:hypothetical protein